MGLLVGFRANTAGNSGNPQYAQDFDTNPYTGWPDCLSTLSNSPCTATPIRSTTTRRAFAFLSANRSSATTCASFRNSNARRSSRSCETRALCALRSRRRFAAPPAERARNDAATAPFEAGWRDPGWGLVCPPAPGTLRERHHCLGSGIPGVALGAGPLAVTHTVPGGELRRRHPAAVQPPRGRARSDGAAGAGARHLPANGFTPLL